jgi:hypothetical protein
MWPAGVNKRDIAQINNQWLPVSLFEPDELPLETVDLRRIELAPKHDTSKAILLVSREPERAHAQSLTRLRLCLSEDTAHPVWDRRRGRSLDALEMDPPRSVRR